MKLQFNRPVQLEIVEKIEENDTPIESQEIFQSGEIIEVDLIDHPLRMKDGELVPDENLWNVQFGDGSMAFGVDREWFDIIG